jgi:adenylosuccinate lyase
VEYFLKEKVADNKELAGVAEFFHFAATSEDVSNLAYALMLSDVRNTVLGGENGALKRVIAGVTNLALKHADAPMLSRTHGQTATPTTLGKEMANFAHRLKRQLRQFER